MTKLQFPISVKTGTDIATRSIRLYKLGFRLDDPEFLRGDPRIDGIVMSDIELRYIAYHGLVSLIETERKFIGADADTIASWSNPAFQSGVVSYGHVLDAFTGLMSQLELVYGVLF